MNCYTNSSLYYTAPDVDAENVEKIVNLMTEFYKFTCNKNEASHPSKFYALKFCEQHFYLRPYQSKL